MDKKEVSKNDVGIFTVVAIVLAVLKIFSVIEITWKTIICIWLIPLWVVLGLIALLVVLYIIDCVKEEKK